MRQSLFSLCIFTFLSFCAFGQNAITFQVNMCQQVASGAFDPATQVVFVTGGNANQTGNYASCGQPMTDADGDGIFEITQMYPMGYAIDYKFYIGGPGDAGTTNCDGSMGGYEPNLPTSDCGINQFGDRQHIVAGLAVLPTVCFGSCDPCANCDAAAEITVPFCVDMNCADTAERPPAITGPSYGWCDGCNPMTDPDGDDIWCLDLTFPEGTMLEYKYQSNGWTAQEDLVDDVIAGAMCAPINDPGAGFANRLITITPGMMVNDVYGSCGLCPPGVPVDVPFCVDMNCADTAERPPAVTGPLWGWCDGCNPMTDPDGDDVWCITMTIDAGTIVEYKYQANGWTAQEDLVDDMIAGASCAPVWDAMGDPNPYANRQFTVAMGVSINDVYGSCATSCVTDCEGVVGGTANPGTACDDGNANTSNDVYDANCMCVGEVLDCLGVPNGTALPGSACDDADATTYSDVYDANCNCAGIPYDCPALAANVGDGCNDNNPNTANDTIDANCNCVGTSIFDCPSIAANIGDSCDDGNPNTGNDSIQADCSCAGLAFDCENVAGGSANPFTPCDDGDPTTVGDTWDPNCSCIGLVVDCAGVAGGNAQVDCNNDCNGTAFVDGCGTCVGGNTGLEACGNDCLGVPGGTAVADCNGDCNGTAFVDGCGNCVGGNTGLAACTSDCAGVPGGSAVVDCNNDCNGTASIDACGNCVGGNTGLSTVIGCTNPTANNYDPSANCDDGGCVYSCPDPGNCDDGDCSNGAEVWDAVNCNCVITSIPDPSTCVDNMDCTDGFETWDANTCSCIIAPSIIGCTDPSASNYDPVANCDDASCIFSSFDCPALGANFGDQCDDGNPNTVADLVNSDCVCAGWIPDCTGLLGGPDLPNTPCDDGNPNTANDTWDANCNCSGICVGVLGCTNPSASNYNPAAICDDGSCTFATFDCPALGANIADQCDDGNPNTVADLVNSDCVCAGWIPDCTGLLGGPDLPNTPCDDGNPNTANDTWDANCNCVGVATDCAGVPGGNAVADCNGDCNGTAYFDICGNCVGGNTGNAVCQATCGNIPGFDVCNCGGMANLILDSSPCFLSSDKALFYLLVDVANGIITTDADNNEILAVNSSINFNAPTGDYVIYEMIVPANTFSSSQLVGTSFDSVIALFDALAGGQTSPGVWQTDGGDSLTASGLITVNGSQCGCDSGGGSGGEPCTNGGGCIGDYVYCADGGIGNITIALYDANNSLIATDVTDMNGAYNFCGLPNGTYQVVAGTVSNANIVGPGFYTIGISDCEINGSADFQYDGCGPSGGGGNGGGGGGSPNCADIQASETIICMSATEYSVILSFSGIYDGGGYTITRPDGSQVQVANVNGYQDPNTYSTDQYPFYAYTITANSNPDCFVTLGPVTAICVPPSAISLVDFDGTVAGKANYLHWSTASETDNSHFTLMRSDDGQNFEPVTVINSQGNSSSTQYYEYSDFEYRSSISYYKLMETDNSGQSSYAGNVVVIERQDFDFNINNVYPVPTSNIVNIDFRSGKTEELTVSVFDVTGKQIEQFDVEAQGGNNLLELNIGHYAVGTYFINIASDSEVMTAKFVKD